MAEEHSQAFGKTERHESVWKTQEKIILGVLGEKQGSFLGTGRAEMEAFAAERAEELVSTFGVGALYSGDTLSIVPAENELLHYLRDALQTEASEGRGIVLLIGVCELLEVLLEKGLKHVRSALAVRRGSIGIEVKRELCLHMEI